METLGFLWISFSMALRFLEVFTVRFHPLPERQPSLPSSLKQQIASDTVCRERQRNTQTSLFHQTSPFRSRGLMVCGGIIINDRPKLHILEQDSATARKYMDDIFENQFKLLTGVEKDTFIKKASNSTRLDQNFGEVYDIRKKNFKTVIYTTVGYIAKKYVETYTVESPGGPSKLTSRAKRTIVRSTTNKPMTSAQNIANELLSSCNVSVSAQTVGNVVNSDGLKARTPRTKPYFSEYSKNLEKNKRDLEPQNVLPTLKHGGKNVLVWGCVAHNGAGNLAFIDSKMNALDYMDVLRHNLIDSAKKLSMRNTFIFQREIDPKHTAIVTKTGLHYHAPRRLETPPQSQDLNPIKKIMVAFGH
ncbi:uncharacterized protein TNCV_1022141 [Trichonephila clavipes]|nr:uncharacterized protein TNCV_1022141 [Trichonephila clavipes]